LKKLLVIILCFAWASAGCALFESGNTDETRGDFGERDELQPFPVFIDDAVVSASPERIISLSPALTEILFEFGYGDRLIGRSRHCNYPTGAGSIAVYESGSGFSGESGEMQRIIRLAPDLLLLSSPIPDIDRITLGREGIAVVIIPPPRSLEEFRGIYRLAGVILYGGFVGESMGDAQFAEIAQSCSNPYGVDLGGFVYITENMSAATEYTLESSVLSGFGTNLAQSQEQGRGYVSDLTPLLENQPDTILLSDVISRESLNAHPILSQLDAVRAGRIITIDNARFERPSVRITELIRDLRFQYNNLGGG
jgi:iron complex transport system substrate-binding protein